MLPIYFSACFPPFYFPPRQYRSLDLARNMFKCENVGAQTVMIDNRCLEPENDPYVGKGCNAGDQGPICRFCGFEDFPKCFE